MHLEGRTLLKTSRPAILNEWMIHVSAMNDFVFKAEYAPKEIKDVVTEKNCVDRERAVLPQGHDSGFECLVKREAKKDALVNRR